MTKRSKAIELLEEIKGVLSENGTTEFSELPKKEKNSLYWWVFDYATNVCGNISEINTVETYLKFDDIDCYLGCWYAGDNPYEPFSVADLKFTDYGRKEATIKFDEEESTLFSINKVLEKIKIEQEKVYNFVNLTPHDFNLYNAYNELIMTAHPSGSCRVMEKTTARDPINGINVNRINYNGVEGLPDPRPNTIYIVSLMVLQALDGLRPDCVAPNTGADAVRDGGRIIGTRSFTVI